MPGLTIDERWRWWREQLGSPRFVMAPMVLQSELAFRQLARRHGCELCYSPMLPAAAFLASREAGEPEHPETGGPQTREAWVTSSRDGTDRPLLVQLGGSDVDELLAAARLVQDRCDGVDLNLGCPQRCAEQGGYGAFLLTRSGEGACSARGRPRRSNRTRPRPRHNASGTKTQTISTFMHANHKSGTTKPPCCAVCLRVRPASVLARGEPN